jgi:hypothetical protein
MTPRMIIARSSGIRQVPFCDRHRLAFCEPVRSYHRSRAVQIDRLEKCLLTERKGYFSRFFAAMCSLISGGIAREKCADMPCPAAGSLKICFFPSQAL